MRFVGYQSNWTSYIYNLNIILFFKLKFSPCSLFSLFGCWIECGSVVYWAKRFLKMPMRCFNLAMYFPKINKFLLKQTFRPSRTTHFHTIFTQHIQLCPHWLKTGKFVVCQTKTNDDKVKLHLTQFNTETNTTAHTHARALAHARKHMQSDET